MKKIIVFLVLPFFLCFLVYCMTVVVAAAPVVSAGEALAVTEILELLDEYELIDLDQAGNYFTPSIYLRMLSGVFDAGQIDVSDAAPWLQKLFDLNNELFWSSDGATVLQEHNGDLIPVSSLSDLWLTTDGMSESLIPYNYVAQSPGGAPNINFEGAWIVRQSSGYPSQKYYFLPLNSYGDSVYIGSCYILFDWDSLNYTFFDTYLLEQASDPLNWIRDITSYPNQACGYYSPGGRAQLATYSSSLSLAETATLSMPVSLSWLDSSTGDVVDCPSGDKSYLYYTSEPLRLPTDIPSGNYVYTNTPDDTSGAVVISPDGDFANLWDYLTNGFQFTGSIEVQGDYNITADLHYSGSLGLSHSGDITINFNDDLNLWADDGKATDFGNGVSLDGNAFNDGFKWLLDGVAAVPVVLASFAFVPAPVIGIITSALVVMVFLGLWRTFKG